MRGTVVQVKRSDVQVGECRSVTDTLLVVKRSSVTTASKPFDAFGADLDFLRGISVNWTCADRPSPTGGAFGIYGISEVRAGDKVVVYASDMSGWTRTIVSPNGLEIDR